MEEELPPWMKRLIAPHILSIPRYVPGKPVAELQRELGINQAVKMASNENALGPSPLAIRAIQDHLQSAHVYPESSAPELRQAIAQHFGVGADSVILGNGSDEIMQMAAHLLVRPGDEAVIGANTFSMYRIVTEAFGGKTIRVPLKEYRLDLEAMAAAVTDRTRLIFVAIPNSPTGTVVKRGEFEAFLKALPTDRLLLVLDEAYREYVRESDCPRGLDYLEGPVAMLVLRTMSKMYGLAGLRIGYGLAEPWLVELLNRVRPPFNANLLAQVAALAALHDTEHVERSLKMTHEGIAYLSRELEALGLEVIPSQANFVTFCLGTDARDVFDGLLRLGVIVRHLASFGMDTCIRVTVGTTAENRRFMSALKMVIK
jgi:histidinol-phosphate aminotransferase